MRHDAAPAFRRLLLLRSIICWAVIALTGVLAVLFSVVLAEDKDTVRWAISGAASVALRVSPGSIADPVVTDRTQHPGGPS